MKKSIFTLLLALTAVLAINAQQVFTGTIYVTRNGQTNIETATVTILDQDNGNNLHTLELQVPFMGTDLDLVMSDVHSALVDGITTYSAERIVPTGTYFGSLQTIIFARVTGGMIAADVSIPKYGVTMWFNTVGNHFQLPNSDFEAWNNDNGEPDRWHGFKTATGTYAGTSAGLVKLEASEDVRNGATGHSAVMTAGSIFGIVANGTMTNGRLNAGAMSAGDTRNHAEMDKNNGTDEYYMPLYAKPDKFNVWLKYTQGTANADNKANVSVKTFDGTYYQEPVDKEYTNLSGSIVGGQIPAGDWTHYSFSFDYDSYAANGATSDAIFVTFSTNGNPGQGSRNDALYVDDIELIYMAQMTDLRYQGVTIEGWNPAVTTYDIEMPSEPVLDDFDADVTGASALVLKSMEQNEDGTYRVAICAVPADLQAATCYVINVTVASVLMGDVNSDGAVNISDVTALVDYLLKGSGNINLQAADVDGDNQINISDLTSLIDLLLSGN